MDPNASIIMAAALAFYSIGVWGERIQGRLKPWHLVFFVLGLICDTWGTGLMFEYVGGLTFGCCTLKMRINQEGKKRAPEDTTGRNGPVECGCRVSEGQNSRSETAFCVG